MHSRVATNLASSEPIETRPDWKSHQRRCSNQDAQLELVPLGNRGGVAERSNAAVSKTVSGGYVRRGFKSLPLRLLKPFLGPRAFPFGG
jgi:hypothetical protein